MSNSAVDLFHDRVVELLRGKKSLTTNSIAIIWAECKELEDNQLIHVAIESIRNMREAEKKDTIDYDSLLNAAVEAVKLIRARNK